MKGKLAHVIAGGLAVLVLGAVPAVASAAEWVIDPESGTFPMAVTVNSGPVLLTFGLGTISCESVSGTGQYTTSTTGDLQLAFHVCKWGGSLCTTAGQPAGTTTTTVLTFHTIMIDATPTGTPGILLTSNEGHIATFVCQGFTTYHLNGNGFIGEITNPTCSTGTFQKTSTITFESLSTGSQKYKQIETAGTIYDETLEGPGGGSTTSIDGVVITEFTSTKAKMTCP